MANIKSNAKSHRKNEKARKLSHSKNSEVRTSIKKTRITKSQGDLSNLYSIADKSAKTKRIHRNKVNRIKSRTAIAISK